MNHDDPNRNAEEYATLFKSENEERMKIKGKSFTWSDDLYPAISKRFSNVQKVEYNFRGNEMRDIRDQMSIVVRCTGRDQYFHGNSEHPFSLVITLEETDDRELRNESLYDELGLVNTLEAIGEIVAEAEA
jgi:hypothetical protein